MNNRVRVYFAPTPAGLAYLQQLVAAYREMTTAIDGMLALTCSPGGAIS